MLLAYYLNDILFCGGDFQENPKISGQGLILLTMLNVVYIEQCNPENH